MLSRSLLRTMSTARSAPLLLTPAQVSALPTRTTVLLDASWVMPNSPREPIDEFGALRVPRARFLDIDAVASHMEEGERLGLKHMMPSADVFAKACESLGIARDSHVVVYDTQGLFSAPRALFMFRAFSHANSSLLNGGLPRWIDEGYAVETDPPSSASTSTSYPVPPPDESVIRSYAQMVNNSTVPRSDATAELVLDARSRGRYLGTDPEPRPNLSSGHIPFSFSLPFNAFTKPHAPHADSPLRVHPLLAGGYTTLRAPDELVDEVRKAVGPEYAAQILEGRRSVVATCGSGMTAAVLWLGLQSVWEAQGREGGAPVGIYDESWTGYAARKESKIAKGEE